MNNTKKKWIWKIENCFQTTNCIAKNFQKFLQRFLIFLQIKVLCIINYKNYPFPFLLVIHLLLSFSQILLYILNSDSTTLLCLIVNFCCRIASGVALTNLVPFFLKCDRLQHIATWQLKGYFLSSSLRYLQVVQVDIPFTRATYLGKHLEVGLT